LDGTFKVGVESDGRRNRSGINWDTGVGGQHYPQKGMIRELESRQGGGSGSKRGRDFQNGSLSRGEEQWGRGN